MASCSLREAMVARVSSVEPVSDITKKSMVPRSEVKSLGSLRASFFTIMLRQIPIRIRFERHRNYEKKE
jgi:hypothetical protein